MTSLTNYLAFNRTITQQPSIKPTPFTSPIYDKRSPRHHRGMAASVKKHAKGKEFPNIHFFNFNGGLINPVTQQKFYFKNPTA